MSDDKKDKLVKKLSMKEAKPGTQSKRKGLGGLGPEKKKLLKKLIMQKANEVMKAEMQRRAKEKEEALKNILEPLKLDGLNKQQLESKAKELYKRYVSLEEEKYDLEVKVQLQDFEVQALTLKCNDQKGKFIKPVLKKVPRSESGSAKKGDRESKLLTTSLKSTGQNKFAIEEKETGPKTPDWREQLKPTAKETEHESTNATVDLGD